MKLVPLSDRVVLKQLEAEETTKSGIILTSSAQEKPQEAEVIAVGPGGMVDGKEVKMQVTVGQKVIYSKYAGTEVKLDIEESSVFIHPRNLQISKVAYFTKRMLSSSNGTLFLVEVYEHFKFVAWFCTLRYITFGQ